MVTGAVSVVAAVQLGLGVVTVGPVHQVAVVVVVFNLIERQSLRIQSNLANFKPRQSQDLKDDSWIFLFNFFSIVRAQHDQVEKYPTTNR